MAKRNTRRERKTFTDEYKQNVLELVCVGNKSISQICRGLGLNQSFVHSRIKADQETNGPMIQNSLNGPDHAELERNDCELRKNSS